MSVLRSSLLFVALFVVAGCAPPKPPEGTVEGTVTLDGTKPLASGEIIFELDGGGEAPRVLTITDGKFEGKARVGKNKVAIYSYKDFTVPKGQPGEGTVSKTNTLPPRYGQDSTETREVTAAGPNKFDFKVTSK